MLIKHLLILPLVVVTGPGVANQALGQQVQMGMRLGVVFSRFAGEGNFGDRSFDKETGLTAGVFAGIRLGRAITLYPELAYSKKGAHQVGSATDVLPEGNVLEQTVTHTVSLHYLDFYLPIAVQIPLNGSSAKPRLYGGPSLALELACGVELAIRSEIRSPTGELLDAERSVASGSCGQPTLPGVEFPEASNLDFGLLFGVGLDIALGGAVISGDVRYDLGLTDIAEGGSLRNRALQLLVGYSR